MEQNIGYFILAAVFGIGYLAIILEHYVKINKTASALFTGIVTWVLYIFFSGKPLDIDLKKLHSDLSSVAEILIFLLAAMTIVELIDSHKGFRFITDKVRTRSKKKLFYYVTFLTFFLSAILDNLTSTILMVSLLKKLIPNKSERFSLACLVVIAANAGGAWTPIGDVTTSMLWIGQQISSMAIMKSLFLPSLVSVLLPLFLFTRNLKGHFSPIEKSVQREPQEYGAKSVFLVGVLGLIFIPIFKAITDLPPFMGALLSLAVLWLITDLMHHREESREKLRVPFILTKIDISSVLFFLGILMSVAALDSAGLLEKTAHFLSTAFKSESIIATTIGIISAIIDNVPLVAATMGMYPLDLYPQDSALWHMIAYAAGTGGSLLIIGSAAGVALMGLEKIDFISYLKKATLPALIGYLAGMTTYLLIY